MEDPRETLDVTADKVVTERQVHVVILGPQESKVFKVCPDKKERRDQPDNRDQLEPVVQWASQVYPVCQVLLVVLDFLEPQDWTAAVEHKEKEDPLGVMVLLGQVV